MPNIESKLKKLHGCTNGQNLKSVPFKLNFTILADLIPILKDLTFFLKTSPDFTILHCPLTAILPSDCNPDPWLQPIYVIGQYCYLS